MFPPASPSINLCESQALSVCSNCTVRSAPARIRNDGRATTVVCAYRPAMRRKFHCHLLGYRSFAQHQLFASLRDFSAANTKSTLQNAAVASSSSSSSPPSAAFIPRTRIQLSLGLEGRARPTFSEQAPALSAEFIFVSSDCQRRKLFDSILSHYTSPQSLENLANPTDPTRNSDDGGPLTKGTRTAKTPDVH
jgi:hypothetical protein